MKAKIKSILLTRAKPGAGKNKAIILKIITVMIITVTTINVFALVMGAVFLTKHLSDSIKQDMLVAVDIADQYVSAEIEMLKVRAADTAAKVELSWKNGDRDQALENSYNVFPMFRSLAVYSRTQLVDFYGELSVPSDLLNNQVIQTAQNGKQGISTTIHNPDGEIVMCVSAPMSDGHVLVAVMPGLYFSELLSEYKLYDTGHIFIDDADGTVIVNIRREWVENRINFIERAKTDNGYEGLASMVTRGISGERGNAEFAVSGVQRFCAFRPVTGSEEGWFLGVIAPKTESPLKDITSSMVLIGIITLSLSVFASILAAGILKRPYDEVESFREVAEAASLTKSNFLANMSHEMRTPLNVVIGLTDLMILGDTTEAENMENAGKIRTAGLTLLGIVNDILDISKIESGKLTLSPVNYDTASFLNDSITLNIMRIAEKPITFNLDISDGFYSQLYGDDLRVKQVMNNLLSNAFKYTREGTVTLKIRGNRNGSGDIWIDITVSDTGIGIRPEDISKLFSDYNQVDTKANRKIEGTGLGLSITKKLVEMMGGSIEVQSEYGKGTEFHICIKQGYVNDIPIGPTVANNLRSFQYSEEKRSDAKLLIPVNLSYARVLVVDDFQTNLDVATGLMHRYKMKIDCVTSGQESVDRIRRMDPVYDAIFMDHMMPEMDGMEAAKRIRELDSEYAKTVPIICLTANAIVGNEEMFLNNGFQAFLSKPIDIKKLDKVLKQWVRDQSRESGNIEVPATPGSEASAVSPGVAGSAEPAGSGQDNNCRIIQIPGIDSKKGLSLYGNDSDIYMSILRSYAANMPAITDSLRNVTEENISAYAINVHGLKGSSGNIGATDVMERAARMEAAAKAGDLPGVLAENGKLLEDARTLEAAIQAWLTINDSVNEKSHLPAPDPALLKRLGECCALYNMNEVDEIMDDLEKFYYDTDNDLIIWLREKINLSDFTSVAGRIATE